MAHSHDDRRTVTRGFARELSRSPVPRMRGLAPTLPAIRLAEALAVKPAMRPMGVMPRFVTTPRPGLHDLARALADTPGKRLARALAPINRVSEALAPINRVSEALAPINRVSEALAPVNRVSEALAPVNRVSEALAPVNRVSEALAPVTQMSEMLAPVIRTSEVLSPVTQLAEVFAPLRPQPRLGHPVPSLFCDQPSEEPQMETRLVRVRGTREDWAMFDDGHTVGLTRR